jgi:hypothetical protein
MEAWLMGNGEKKLQVKYTYSRDYRIVYADSALGGETPRGEFRLEFTATLPPAVISETLIVGGDGRVTTQALQTESDDIWRERQVCVMMSRDTAKNVMDLIAKQLGKNV